LCGSKKVTLKTLWRPVLPNPRRRKGEKKKEEGQECPPEASGPR
jgi:hypothetical protein